MTSARHLEAVANHESDMREGKKRMRRKSGGLDGWDLGQFEYRATFQQQEGRWGTTSETLMLLQRSLACWIGYFLLEAHENIGGASTIWRSFANRSFRAHGRDDDCLKQSILREVYHRLLNWRTFKGDSKLPSLTLADGSEELDLNFFDECSGTKYTEGMTGLDFSVTEFVVPGYKLDWAINRYVYKNTEAPLGDAMDVQESRLVRNSCAVVRLYLLFLF